MTESTAGYGYEGTKHLSSGTADFGHDLEDDVDIVSVAKVDAMVIMDPGQRETEIRGRLSDQVESYISACSFASGSVPKASSYLRLLPGCVPFREIHVGQSSYQAGILPSYASAFAFDYRAIGSWTPTAQVLGQAMESEFGVPIEKALCLLANNYLLAPRGLVFINVAPYEKCGDQLHTKLESRVAELLANMAFSSAALGCKKVVLMEYGDDAKAAGDAFWASVKSALLPVSRISVRNPVWVSRNFPNAPEAQQPSPSSVTLDVCARYSPRRAGLQGRLAKQQQWRTYTRNQLSHVRPHVTVRLISSLAMSESIEQAVLSFDELVRNMSQRGARSTGGDDPESYVHQMLRQIGEDSQAQVATAREALELARDVASKIKKDNKESVEAMIPVLRSCVDAQVMAAGFFSSLPSILSSDTASLSLGINTLPPIIKAYSSSWEAGTQVEGSRADHKVTTASPKHKLTVRRIGGQVAVSTKAPENKGQEHKGTGEELGSKSGVAGRGTGDGERKESKGKGKEREERGGSAVGSLAVPDDDDNTSAVVLGVELGDDLSVTDPFSEYEGSSSAYGSYGGGPYSVGLRHDPTGEVEEESPFDYEDYAAESGLEYPSVFGTRTGAVVKRNEITKVIGAMRSTGPRQTAAYEPAAQKAHEVPPPRKTEPPVVGASTSAVTTGATTAQRQGGTPSSTPHSKVPRRVVATKVTRQTPSGSHSQYGSPPASSQGTDRPRGLLKAVRKV